MKNVSNFFISAISIVVLLIYGKTLLIPFVFALLLWFLTRKIRYHLNTINFIQNKIPNWIKNLFILGFMFLILSFVSKLLILNINNLAKSYSNYEGNVEFVIQKMNETFNINLIEILKTNLGELDFGNILKQIFNSLSDLLGNAFLIIIYAVFIFLEEVSFTSKLKKALAKNDQYDNVSEILEKIEHSINSYISLKTLVSIITGVLSYIALLLIGIEAPLFWAFLIFILNFIPTIGSLIATLFPAIFCLLQFGEFTPALMVLGFVGAIQVLVGNFIEPKMMGSSLNISPLVAIFALSFWGVLWGVTGMILSIPITVIITIVLSHFPATRSVAIMLSDKVRD